MKLSSFYEQVLSCRPDEILKFISKMCNSGRISAYLFRRLSVGAVFLFVDNNTNEVTVIVFGYESCFQNRLLEKEYIYVTTIETMELIKTSESTNNYFSLITGIAAIQESNCIAEIRSFKISDCVSKLIFSSDIHGEEASEKTDVLVHIFHAIQTNQSKPIIQ